MLNWYKELIRLRRQYGALHNYNKDCIQVRITDGGILEIERWDDHSRVMCLYNVSEKRAEYKAHKDLPKKIMDSYEQQWQEKSTKSQANKVLPAEVKADSVIELCPWAAVLYEVI
jgi:glycosidase